MPWKVMAENGEHCIYKLDADGTPMGKTLGCHPTEGEAMAQMRALYANEPGVGKSGLKFMDMDETVLEGLIAPYGGIFNGRDVQGEFFAAKTDFVLDWFPGERPLLYQHGFDSETGVSVVGRMKIGPRTDEGLWMRSQLDIRGQYFKAIQELVKARGLDLSSGTMKHLVQVDKSGEIKRWPLIEGSLTPTPANLLARVDFATAEKHFDMAGMKSDFDAAKAVMDAEQRNALSNADFAHIDAQGGQHLPMNDEAHARAALARFNQTTFESDAAKQAAKRKLIARCKELGIDVSPDFSAGKSVNLGELLDQVREAFAAQYAMPMPPGMASPDCYVEQVFDDAVIAEFGESAYRIPYTVGTDGAVAFATRDQWQRVQRKTEYVPVEPMGKTGDLIASVLHGDQAAVRAFDSTSLADHAEFTARVAASLLERTKDLRGRRVKEGRVISTANREKMAECMAMMQKAMDGMMALMDSMDPATAQAKSQDLRRLRMQLESLRLRTMITTGV